MKLCNAITAGVKHLAQNRLRAGLSILGIFIGIAGVLCMIAIGEGGKKIITEDIEKLGGANQFILWTRTSIWKSNSLIRRTTERYTLEDAYAIEAECPEVLFALPNHEDYEVFVTRRNGNQARPLLEGVTADYALGMNWKLQAGRFLTENDIETAAQVCVLGSDTAIELFGEASPLGQEVKVRLRYSRQTPVRMRVVGVMKPKGRSLTWSYSLDYSICVPLTVYQQRLTGKRYVEHLIIFFQNGADLNSTIDSVKGIVRKRHRGQDDFIAHYTPKLTFHRLEHIQKVIKIALGSIASFSLFVSGISIMNICLVSVGEKTREIGLRKSVGAKQRHIFWQFLMESMCLCFCGGVLGIAGGWGAAHGMARLAVRIVPVVEAWPVVLSLSWILISVIFSIVMGVGFGVYPATRAARLSPIDALRTEY